MSNASEIYDDYLNTTTIYYLFGIFKVAESVGYWDESSLRLWCRPLIRIKHVTKGNK